jgi:transposase InsO family protein
VDLGDVNGRNFLVMVDSFSGWPHVVAFSDTKTSARAIIGHIRTFFSSVGVPVTFWSDNGPQFGAAEFRRFLTDWGILPSRLRHITPNQAAAQRPRSTP